MVYVECQGLGLVTVRRPSDDRAAVGERVGRAFAPERMHFLDEVGRRQLVAALDPQPPRSVRDKLPTRTRELGPCMGRSWMRPESLSESL